MIDSYNFGDPYAGADVYDAAKWRKIRIVGISLGVLAVVGVGVFLAWPFFISQVSTTSFGYNPLSAPREMVVVTKDTDDKSDVQAVSFSDVTASGEWKKDGVEITVEAKVSNIGGEDVLPSLMPVLTYGSDKKAFKFYADIEHDSLYPEETVTCSFTSVVPEDCEEFGISHSPGVEDEGMWRVRNEANEALRVALVKHEREKEAEEAARKEEEKKAKEAKKAEEEAKKKAEEEAKKKAEEENALARRLSDQATSTSSSRVFDMMPNKSVDNEEAWVSAWGDAIDAYLNGRGDVPLKGYGRQFAQAAWDYDCDPRISVCISETESGNGAVCFLPYNAWGWLGHSFSSFEDGIKQHAEYLSSFYGMPFTKEVYATYCGGENTDYLWDWIWRSAETIVPSTT